MSLFVMERYYGEEEETQGPQDNIHSPTKNHRKKKSRRSDHERTSRKSDITNDSYDDEINRIEKKEKKRKSKGENEGEFVEIGLKKKKCKDADLEESEVVSDDDSKAMEENNNLESDVVFIREKKKSSRMKELVSNDNCTDVLDESDNASMKRRKSKKHKHKGESTDEMADVSNKEENETEKMDSDLDLTNEINELTDEVDKKRKKKKNKIRNDCDETEMVQSGKRKMKKIKDERIDDMNEIDDSGTQTKNKRRHKIDKNLESSFKKKIKITDSEDNEDNVKREVSEDVNEEVIKDEKEHTNDWNIDHSGFTYLGRVDETPLEKVQRTLPDWIRCPTVVSPDLLTDQQPLSVIPGISSHIIQTLQNSNIQHFFPVQLQVIPAILNNASYGNYYGKAGSRPRDICCSAPTGSGKTLAFVIPIVQLLEKRVVPQIRCVVLLPTGHLASQVYQVFQQFVKPTKLKVTLFARPKDFEEERAEVIQKTASGYKTLVDIIVTTPGKFVHHMTSTPGFDLRHLRYLVIDEADRMMSQIEHDWWDQLQEAVFSTNPSTTLWQYPAFKRTAPSHMTPANNLKMEIPLQKLIFSATLSLNPEILQQLHLFQPTLYTSLRTKVKKEKKEKEIKDEKPNYVEDIIGALVKPQGLEEYICIVKAQQKPHALVHMLKNLQYKRVLCFTNNVESAKRLNLLLCNVDIKSMEISSNIGPAHRVDILRQFSKGKVDVLVCTDSMARGMDIDVQYVISYDMPHYILSYMHRVGRTARAGAHGTAITLLMHEETHQFREMMLETGNKKLKDLNVDHDQMMKLSERISAAITKTSVILEKTASVSKKKKHQNPLRMRGTPDSVSERKRHILKKVSSLSQKHRKKIQKETGVKVKKQRNVDRNKSTK